MLLDVSGRDRAVFRHMVGDVIYDLCHHLRIYWLDSALYARFLEAAEVHSLDLHHLFPGDFRVPDCSREQKVWGGGGLFPGDFGVPDCPREQKVGRGGGGGES